MGTGIVPGRWIVWVSLAVGALLLGLLAFSRKHKALRRVAQKVAIATAEATHKDKIKNLRHQIEILKDSEEADREAIDKISAEISFRKSRLRDVYAAAEVPLDEIEQRLKAMRFPR